MDDIAIVAMQDPGSEIAWNAPIIRNPGLCDVVEIFVGLGGGNPAMPSSCNHSNLLLLEVLSARMWL
jgi:hypothetical protein